MRFSPRLIVVFPLCLAASACSGGENGFILESETGGSSGTGGSGLAASGGAQLGTGSVSGAGGHTGSGGNQAAGGGQSTGGQLGGGGFPGFPSGGASSGGSSGSGGATAAAGGGPAGSGGAVALDCNAAMPTSGAQQHSGNGQGGSDNLAWQIWSNMGTGSMTTYPTTAFTASWNNSGDYLGRMGFEWGGFQSTPKPYEDYGIISAQFASKKTGSAGQYSYIGMYGWSTDPCVEWYIVDDSFNNMPVNPGNTTNKGEVKDIDGGTYIMYTRNTSGTGGSRCSSSITNWIQYYSVRKTARACGEISLTKHFDAWKSLDMPLGNLLEATILVEVGGGSGSVDFPVANVTTTK